MTAYVVHGDTSYCRTRPMWIHDICLLTPQILKPGAYFLQPAAYFVYDDHQVGGDFSAGSRLMMQPLDMKMKSTIAFEAQPIFALDKALPRG